LFFESIVVVKDKNVVHAKTTFEASFFDHIANLLRLDEPKKKVKKVELETNMVYLDMWALRFC
jgi:hypothetical protein